MNKLIALIKAGLRRVVNEPAVVLGVVIAAINTTDEKSWKGYAVAVATALLRFLVTPVTKTNA